MKRLLFNRLSLVLLDAVFISLAFAGSIHWYAPDRSVVYPWFLLFLFSKLFCLSFFGLYRQILTFAGLPLAASIIKAVTVASVLCFAAVQVSTHLNLSAGFFLTDYLMTNFCIGIIRFFPRYLRELRKSRGENASRVLIYGAGILGEAVARTLQALPEQYRVVGFLDDQVGKQGRRLHNVPVCGPVGSLAGALERLRVNEVVIAISALDGEVVRQVIRECRHHKVLCRIAPSVPDMLKKDVNIKNLDVSDLLRREPKDLDKKQIQQFIRGKTILITGAGGSIGSELARQCLRYQARRLVLVDHSEFNLYTLENELGEQPVPLRFALLNILHPGMESLMDEERPQVVFHAAAYKHVPILEANSFAGVQNNIGGTVRMVELADRFGVEKFVLISTDKAVRPANVMGATKRVAELYIQNFNPRSRTDFVAVRFGNVLGSSGSVIPKFIDQINRGGPVTVTHPEVTRYFMLISEAVQLVMQAAGLGRGGEIFILNMGQPIKIAEMAEDLIFLAGREPHRDIAIEYVGLRPGEKLYEELLNDDVEERTQYENITIGHSTHVAWEWLLGQIRQLTLAVEARQDIELLQTLKILIPEFQHAAVLAEEPVRKPVLVGER